MLKINYLIGVVSGLLFAALALANELPTITVTAPVGNQTIPGSQNSVDFAGTAADSDGTVKRVQYRINGGPWTDIEGDLNNWSFTATDLTLGQNSVVVRALDNQNGTSQELRTLIERQPDGNLPTVTVTAPPNNQNISNGQASVEFAGTAAANNSTITRVEYRINGGPWVSAEGTDSWTFSASGFAPGRNIVVVRAIDDQNRTSAEARRVITREVVLSDPTLTVTNPPGDATIANDQTSLNFAGSAADDDGSIARIEYRVNGGTWTDIEADNPSSWAFTAGGLTLGASAVVVRAIDNQNRTSEEIRRTVTRQPPADAPVVGIVVPIRDSAVTDASSPLMFSGTASDPNGSVTRIEYSLNGGPWVIADGTAEWSFTIDEWADGDNVVRIRAQDDSGQNGGAEIRVISVGVEQGDDLIFRDHFEDEQ